MIKILVLLFLFLCSVSAQAEVCFKNQTEYEAVKAQLPKVLQKVPLYLKFKFLKYAAVGNLRFTPEGTRFYFNGNKNVTNEEVDEPAKICATETELRIVMPVKTEVIEITGDSDIKVRQQLPMSLASENDYKEIAAIIASQNLGASGNNNNSNSTSPSGGKNR